TPGSVKAVTLWIVIYLGTRSPVSSSSRPAVSSSTWARLTAYLALLQLGFTMPRPLPCARWALTPPFHPYLHLQAVCFLWHCPSRHYRAQVLPGSLPMEPGRSSAELTDVLTRLSGRSHRRTEDIPR